MAVLSQWLLKVNLWHIEQIFVRESEKVSEEMNIVIERTRLCCEEGKWVSSTLSVRGHKKQVSQHCLFTHNRMKMPWYPITTKDKTKEKCK